MLQYPKRNDQIEFFGISLETSVVTLSDLGSRKSLLQDAESRTRFECCGPPFARLLQEVPQKVALSGTCLQDRATSRQVGHLTQNLMGAFCL